MGLHRGPASGKIRECGQEPLVSHHSEDVVGVRCTVSSVVNICDMHQMALNIFIQRIPSLAGVEDRASPVSPML